MMHWLVEFWFFSINLIAIPDATVGLGVSCRYHPVELQLALMENQLVFLTNEFTINGLHLDQEKVHLIGGFDNCSDIQFRVLGQKKTKISGVNESVAVTINSPGSGSIILENFEIFAGHSNQAGGIEVIDANQFKLSNSLIHGNVSEHTGGGIHFMGDGVNVEILNSKIFNNTAKIKGGGIAISGHYNVIKIYDTLVFANQAGYAGGGLSCQNNNQIDVYHNQAVDEPWISTNASPLANNTYQDLSCQFQLNLIGYIDFSGIK